MVKIVNWNGHDLHTMEWSVNNEVEWYFLGSEIVLLLEYKDNFNTVLNGNSKTRAKVRDKYKIKLNKKEIDTNFGESPKFKVGRNGDILVSELGVYELILKSDMKQAEEFQDFVFGLLKDLREKSGLEQFEVFRMLDKKVQLDIQKIVAEVGDLDSGAKNCIVTNTSVNKLISCELFGFNKPLNKAEMETHAKMMLIDRQEVLGKYADYLIVADGSHKGAYAMTSKWIKFKYGHLLVG